jgi:hypothetical protein
MAKMLYTVRCGLPTPALATAIDAHIGVATTTHEVHGSRRKLLQLARFMAGGEQDGWYQHICRRVQGAEIMTAAQIVLGTGPARYKRHCTDASRFYHVATSVRVVTRLGGRVLFEHTAADPAGALIAQGEGNLRLLAEGGQADSQLYRDHVVELRELRRQLIDQAYHNSRTGVHANLGEFQAFLAAAQERRAELAAGHQDAATQLGV